LLALYGRSTKFIHLAYLDHCPNVVVDAQACGCEVVCSSTGGTNEIVYSGQIINEKEWNFEPIKLYEPPSFDFDNIDVVSIKNDVEHSKIFDKCLEAYKDTFKSII